MKYFDQALNLLYPFRMCDRHCLCLEGLQWTSQWKSNKARREDCLDQTWLLLWMVRQQAPCNNITCECWKDVLLGWCFAKIFLEGVPAISIQYGPQVWGEGGVCWDNLEVMCDRVERRIWISFKSFNESRDPMNEERRDPITSFIDFLTLRSRALYKHQFS